MPDINTVVVTPQVSVVQVNSSVPGSYDTVARLGLHWMDVTDPIYGAVGDGVTDDTAAIRLAAAAAAGGVLYFPPATEYLITGSIVLSAGTTVRTHGRQGAIRQSSWGVPAFELRGDNISFPDHIALRYTGSRTTFDAAALAASNNSATVKTECVSDPKAAGSALYMVSTTDGLFVHHVEVFGFIAGILMNQGDNVTIGSVVVEDVDFGLFGPPGNGWQVGSVNAITILRSQGVDEHAVYLTAQSGVAHGFQLGRVTCASVETGASIVSIKDAEEFSVDAIIGHTDVANAFDALDSTGVVGEICVIGTKGSTADLSTSNIIIQGSGVVAVGSLVLTSYQTSGSSSAAVNCTTGATLRIGQARVAMVHGTTPAKAFRSSATLQIGSVDISYTVTPSEYALVSSGTGYLQVDTPPRLTGSALLLNQQNTSTYSLMYNPDLVASLSAATIVADSGTYTTKFVGGSLFADAANNDPSPQVRHTSRVNIAYSGSGIVLGDFDSGSEGQHIFVLFNHTSAGGITVDFTGTDLKGNGGVDWVPDIGDWMEAVLGADGTTWFCAVHET